MVLFTVHWYLYVVTFVYARFILLFRSTISGALLGSLVLARCVTQRKRSELVVL